MPVVSVPRLGVHLSNHGPAAPCLELARLAESEGLDSVWLSEDLYFRGAIPIAGAVAAITSTIDIGFGVLTPYSRHVSLVAMEFASLLDIAGPRVIAGIGAGVAVRTRAMAMDYASPLTTVKEFVDVFRRLMAGEAVTVQGVIQSASDLRLSFTDLPGVPPVYVAAVGPKALEQAGRISDGVVLSLMSSRSYISWAFERIQAGATAAGRGAAVPIVVYMPLAVAKRAEDAVASLKPYIAYYIKRWAPIESLQLLFTEWGPLSRDELVAMAKALEAGQSPAEVITDDLIRSYCIAGDLADCLEQVKELAAAGVTDIVVDPSGDLAAKRDSIHTLAALRRALHDTAR